MRFVSEGRGAALCALERVERLQTVLVTEVVLVCAHRGPSSNARSLLEARAEAAAARASIMRARPPSGRFEGGGRDVVGSADVP